MLFILNILNEHHAPVEYEACPEWRNWPEVFNVTSESGGYYTAMVMYTVFGVRFVSFGPAGVARDLFG